MFYDEGTIDEASLRFASDDKECLLCGPWGASGFVGLPSGGMKMCFCCNGTGKKGGKAHNVQPEVFHATREEFIG